jgi:LysM repeat protein
VTGSRKKIKHLFEIFLTFVVGVLYGSLIRTSVRIARKIASKKARSPSPDSRERVGVKTMSNYRQLKRSRRANIRLARFLVVLSLTTVFGAGFAMQAGAGSKDIPTKANSYVVVTIAPGETIWSVAKALNESGDVRQLVDQIIKVNDLTSSDLAAGSKIRVPLN